MLTPNLPHQDIIFPFDNTYARLPKQFYASLPPTPMPAPQLIQVNQPLAEQLGLTFSPEATPNGMAKIFSGTVVPHGAEPLAMAYAGHQFGGFSPQLGDGRAVLLGEVIDSNGTRHDIQLKGSGQTPFSRAGDGRAVLGPVLREYLVSEAMHALGIPTTRALAATTTGETVVREQPFPGAIITRVAESLVRVGTFQYFAARQDHDALRTLADYIIARHYPDVRACVNPYHAFLEAVLTRQATLIAKWMQVGFIHGVMNTDNTQIAGQTIDYGPCAFMDTYHPDTVYSSIDHGGRYAYANQPRIAHWNLACLASTLLPLLNADQEKAVAEVQPIIDTFPTQYETIWLNGMRQKLGLETENFDDKRLADDLLSVMAEQHADFTLTFYQLSALTRTPNNEDEAIRTLFSEPTAIDNWLCRWRNRLGEESRSDTVRQKAMHAVNPACIPRNHRVEEVIQAALNEDLEPFKQLLSAITAPFSRPEKADLMLPPLTHQVIQQTFCGT